MAEAGIGGEFKLEDFNYTTPTILETLSGHLSRTNFSGITVRQRTAWYQLHWINHQCLVVYSRGNIQTVTVDTTFMNAFKVWRFLGTVMIAKLLSYKSGWKMSRFTYSSASWINCHHLVVYSRGNIHTVMIKNVDTTSHDIIIITTDITSWMSVLVWRYWATYYRVCGNVQISFVSLLTAQGRIYFDDDGIRGGRRLFIYQMRYNKTGNTF